MKIRYSISALLMILLLAACKNGLTIFDQIDQETKLEDAVITGSVNSIVKSGDTLYASDGYIYSKNEKDIRGWSKINGPEGTIIKLAADATNLYALNKNKDLYIYNETNWKKVDVSETLSAIATIFSNGLDTVYIHGTASGATEKSYFKLTGSTITQTTDVASDVIVKTDKGTYTANSGTVTGANNLGSVSDLNTVYSLTYSAVDNAIYAGTSKGLKKLPLDESGKLTGESHNPPGNWNATINAYNAFAVLATGTTTTKNAALYTSTIQPNSTYAKINGLWGYYYSRRDNWNRE
jgi:hypothetical protein